MSVILTGTVYGWDSDEFHADLGMFALGGILMGKGKVLEKFGVADEVGAKVFES